MNAEDKLIFTEFKKLVNLTPKELQAWLKTENSQKVGFKKNEDEESVGHQSGQRILELLQKKPGEYTGDDIGHAQKVIGYIHRHLAQRPKGDVTDTNWRYSLMNWGHDPVK